MMSLPRTCSGLLLGIACAGPAWAGDDLSDAIESADLMSDTRPTPGALDAPRFTHSDMFIEAPRGLPGFRHELNEVSQRWWVSRGRADLGVGLGTVAYVARPIGATGPGAHLPGLASDVGAAQLASGTVLTVGMRYRTSERSAIFADAAGVHGPGFDGGDRMIGKVGIEFKAAQSRWNLAYGGLGLRLSGDTRMSFRLRKGGLGFVMRSTF